MTLQHTLQRFRQLVESALLSRAQRAAEKLAKKYHWPKNPPYWLYSIGVQRDQYGRGYVAVKCAPSFASNFPKQVDGVNVEVETD